MNTRATTHEEWLRDIRADAEKLLADRKLPTAPVVYGEGDSWAVLHAYLEGHGHEFGSVEYAAGKLIWLVDKLATVDAKVYREWQTAVVATQAYLVDRYEKEKRGKNSGGGKRGKRSPLRRTLEAIREQNPEITAEQIACEIEADAEGREGVLYELREQGKAPIRGVSASADGIRYEIIETGKIKSAAMKTIQNNLSQ